jgi:hypothetical protein
MRSVLLLLKRGGQRLKMMMLPQHNFGLTAAKREREKEKLELDAQTPNYKG